MAFRTWAKLLGTTLGVAALAGASQLGLAYGLGILRLTRVVEIASRDQWTAQLAWVAWFAMSAAVLGGLAGRWLRDRWHAPATAGTFVALSLAAGLGAALVVPLTMQPARTARIDGVHPVFVIGVCATLGAAVGVFAAYAVLTQLIARRSLTVTGIAIWVLALLSVAPSLAPDDPLPAVRLGVFDAGYLTPALTQRTALITMPALALISGAILGYAARRRQLPILTIALAGLPGPALLTLAYLIAGPGAGADRYQVVPYWAAMTATGAGVLGSVLAAVIRRAPEAADDEDGPTAAAPPTGRRPGTDDDDEPTASIPAQRPAAAHAAPDPSGSPSSAGSSSAGSPSSGPSFDDSSFGRPSSDDSSFGRPPSSNPPFGPPPSGNPSSGHSAPDSSFGNAPPSDSSFGQSPSNNPSFRRPPSDEPSFGRAPSDDPSFRRPSSEDPSFGRSPSDDSSFGRSPSDDSSFGRSPSEDSSFGRAPSEEPSSRRPASRGFSFGRRNAAPDGEPSTPAKRPTRRGRSARKDTPPDISEMSPVEVGPEKPPARRGRRNAPADTRTGEMPAYAPTDETTAYPRADETPTYARTGETPAHTRTDETPAYARAEETPAYADGGARGARRGRRGSGAATDEPPYVPAPALPEIPPEALQPQRRSVNVDATPERLSGAPLVPEPQAISAPLAQPEPTNPPPSMRPAPEKKSKKQAKEDEYVDWVSKLGNE